MRLLFLAVALTATAAITAPAEADSIWARANPRSAYLFGDDTAHRVGDLITVIIDEQTTVDNDESRSMDKSSGRSAAWGGGWDGVWRIPTMDFTLDVSNDFDGNTQYASDRSITDSITATVVDVLPNGNLVIVGSRRRSVSTDSTIIRISGIVRPSDLSFTNTVSSDRVADFQMEYTPSGQEQLFTSPGVLGRVLDLLWPF